MNNINAKPVVKCVRQLACLSVTTSTCSTAAFEVMLNLSLIYKQAEIRLKMYREVQLFVLLYAPTANYLLKITKRIQGINMSSSFERLIGQVERDLQ